MLKKFLNRNDTYKKLHWIAYEEYLDQEIEKISEFLKNADYGKDNYGFLDEIAYMTKGRYQVVQVMKNNTYHGRVLVRVFACKLSEDYDYDYKLSVSLFNFDEIMEIIKNYMFECKSYDEKIDKINFNTILKKIYKKNKSIVLKIEDNKI